MPVEAHWAQRSGYSRLDQAAMDAVMAWRYVPAKRGEVPVAMWFNVPIAFDLKQHKD
jgi:protein TonB